MWELIIDNWKVSAAVVAFFVMFVVPKLSGPAKSLLAKAKGLKVLKKKEVVDLTVEQMDNEAIRHLRNRAAKFEGEDRDELLKTIKAIHAKFYDAHCSSDCAVNTNIHG